MINKNWAVELSEKELSAALRILSKIFGLLNSSAMVLLSSFARNIRRLKSFLSNASLN
jgi:hypothetical protein